MTKLAVMNISQYIKLERGNAASLANKLNIAPSYLSQLAMPDARVSPARCVEIEQATNRQVTRQDLRPDDWQAIWPELTAPQAATEVVVPSTSIAAAYHSRADYMADVNAGLVKDERKTERRSATDKVGA